MRLRLGPFICALLLVLSPLGQAQKLLFRYQDDQGRMVLNDTLPPSAVTRGYQIIRPDGQVVKTVDPALPPAEVKAAQIAREKAEQQKKWDESLLLRYSDIEDIKEAKKRAVNDIQVRISILKGNRNYLKTQVEREVERAAAAERNGQEVSDEQLKAIKTLKQQLSDVEELVDIREREKNETADQFDRDMARFATLLNEIGNPRK